MLLFFFFFFKQKTAYEIGWCDWSSDVCSSDLVSTYATHWVEHLVREASKESAERQRVVTRLVQSELDTLKLQLNPHFLFNALNSAMALIATDPPAAERMVSELSDFLRLVLSTSSE